MQSKSKSSRIQRIYPNTSEILSSIENDPYDSDDESSDEDSTKDTQDSVVLKDRTNTKRLDAHRLSAWG